MPARKSNLQFIRDARAIHGDRFEYLSPYQTAVKKVEIFCNTCFHTFAQTPNSHLGGQGCPQCARANLLASRIAERDRAAGLFVERARAIHGDRYDYSRASYGKNCESHVSVICREHGEFKISPSNHLKGKGCPSCAKSGFDPEKPSYLYLLIGTTPAHGDVVKVGITNNPRQRFLKNRRADGIDWKLARLQGYSEGFLPVQFEKHLCWYYGEPFLGKERFVFGHKEAIAAFDTMVAID